MSNVPRLPDNQVSADVKSSGSQESKHLDVRYPQANRNPKSFDFQYSQAPADNILADVKSPGPQDPKVDNCPIIVMVVVIMRNKYNAEQLLFLNCEVFILILLLVIFSRCDGGGLIVIRMRQM